jgi:hypothetical protein
MRAAAIPLLIWSALLATLLAINWAWTSDTIQVSSFGFATGVILVWAIVQIIGDRDALRAQPPGGEVGVDAIPQASLGAAASGLAVAVIAFGLVFGRFLVFMGAGLLVASLGLVARELRAQRRALRAARAERQR